MLPQLQDAIANTGDVASETQQRLGELEKQAKQKTHSAALAGTAASDAVVGSAGMLDAALAPDGGSATDVASETLNVLNSALVETIDPRVSAQVGLATDLAQQPLQAIDAAELPLVPNPSAEASAQVALAADLAQQMGAANAPSIPASFAEATHAADLGASGAPSVPASFADATGDMSFLSGGEPSGLDSQWAFPTPLTFPVDLPNTVQHNEDQFWSLFNAADGDTIGDEEGANFLKALPTTGESENSRSWKSAAKGASAASGGIYSPIESGRGPPTPRAASADASEAKNASVSDKDGNAAIRARLNKLKVTTMTDMVKSVDIPMGDSTTTCKFLFLTNQQAADIHCESMYRVREELDLGNPQMVIRLMPSRFGHQWWKSYPYWKGRFPAKQVPELNFQAQESAEHQLLLLAKEVILPIASTSRALVLGQEGCSLTAAFLKVCASTQKQLRDKCRFRVLIFGGAHLFHSESVNPSSIVSHFRNQSDAWKSKTDNFVRALATRFGDDRAYWPSFDLVPGRYSLIIFECLNDQDVISDTVPGNFQNDFISTLTDVPIIALKTYGTDKMNVMPALAEHVTRGFPLLLIDSRRRKTEALDVPTAARELDLFSKELHDKVKRADWYTTSALAIVKNAIDKCREREKGDKEGNLAKQRNMWLWEAIDEMARRKKKTQRQNRKSVKKGMLPRAVTSMKIAAPEEDLLVEGTNVVMSYAGNELNWEMNYRHKAYGEGLEAIKAAGDWYALSAALDANWLKLRGCCFHNYVPLTEFGEKHTWATMKKNGDKPSPKWEAGEQQLIISLENIKDFNDKEYFETSRRLLVDVFEVEFASVRDRDLATSTRDAFVAQETKWMAVYEVLKADNVKTGCLHDIKRCAKTLSELSKIDYLPEDNTFESLVLIRRAWTLYDLYWNTAGLYKIAAKAAIFLMLLLGTVTVVTVTAKTVLPKEAVPDKWKGDIEPTVLLVISLSGTLLAALTTLLEPNRKWLLLRGAALALESEIWKYRTRMCEYSRDSFGLTTRLEAERQAELTFKQVLGNIQDKIDGAGLKRTSFYSIATTAPDTLVDVALEEEALERSNTNLLADVASHTISGISDTALNTAKIANNLVMGRRDRHLSKPKYIQHGQFDTSKWKNPPLDIDNFHSPQLPEDYIRYRLVPLRDYYQRKIPACARKHKLFQAFLLLTSIASALVAATIKQIQLTAVIASIAASASAWQEFNGVEKKLDRYSSIASALENMVVWWQSLPDEEKSLLKCAESLVSKTESMVAGERGAWMSDTQTAARKAEQVSKKQKAQQQANNNSNEGAGDGQNR